MQKKIGYMNIDSFTVSWLKEHLPECELKEGIELLVDGKYQSLMLEMDQGNEMPSSFIIQCGSLCINEKTRSVQQAGNRISLTPKEYDILLFLVKNKGQVFTKEQIYKAVWKDDYVMDDSNIMAFIRKLRKKIEPSPDNPQYILTIWGIGYKFNEHL